MISLRTKIISRKISIPELDSYIGKNVIISIEEDTKDYNMDDFFECVLNVEIDENIIENNRELSLI